MSSKNNYKKPPLQRKKNQKRNISNKKEKTKLESQKKKEISKEKELEKEIEKKEKELEKEILEDEYEGLLVKNIEIEIDKKSDFINKNKKKSGETKDFRTKWKTEICHYWEMNNYCKYGENCAFAHGENELKNRKMSFNYKTKPCKQFFENGFCNYGSRCQFSHKREYFNSSDVSYLKCLNEFKNFEKIDEKMLKRPRLLTFEIIVHSNDEETKENRIKLYEDFISIKNEMKFSDDTTTCESLCGEKNNNKRNRFMSF